ncbi:ABC transporter ATP-binding protein [Paenibacillus sp. ACRSA]|uniref:ABC transporter ATP-binding protein n=1 Tax=Paenibacillus sp. ACRSA TaxID=2918211 RepID=UPI001EF50014|nr:ABC transporter ATP-binding protein [Paenibacillus sp. ACRSA]MCG7379936.1 ABC transporter ATP-binding protein [Paenibacillus sp. ACRSA]
MNSPIIQLEYINKQFKNKLAVSDLSLEIQPGSIVAILGPNGAGKTTTMKMLLGMCKPTSGKISVLGQSPNHQQVRQQIGVMLQDVSVIDGLTVHEIICMVHSYYRNPLPIDEIEHLTGLSEIDLKRRAEKLSGGQKRSLNFALAMAGNPQLLFLDEPTVGMDSETRKHFWKQVCQLTQAGKTVLFTTHYLQEADEAADRIILFSEGRIIADGTPESLKSGLTKRILSFSAQHGMIPGESASPSDTQADHNTNSPHIHIEAQIAMLPNVDQVEYRNGRWSLYTTDTDTLIRDVIQRQLPVRDIRIETGQLDDAYAELLATMKEEQ